MSRKLTLDKLQSSPLFSTNVIFINELYQKYLKNPSSIDSSWADFFADNKDEVESILSDYKGPSWAARDLKVVGSQDFDISSFVKREAVKKDAKSALSNVGKDLAFRVQSLISSYQRFAHLNADIDPLNLHNRKEVKEIIPENHGIESADLEKEVDLDQERAAIFGKKKAKISEIIDYLDSAYRNKIGAEFEYIYDDDQKAWLEKETELLSVSSIAADEKIKILKEVIRTERFEQFLHKRFPGAKRFSIEGGDSTINSIEKIIDVAAKSSVKKVIIGMAHRGRLNTLTGVMGKPYKDMIASFQGAVTVPEDATKMGDVKYHYGYSNEREIGDKKISLSLAFNPSHLEAVNSVVMGRVRSKQDLIFDKDKSRVVPFLIHGDAAFVGQGSVAESLVISGVEGYDVGGVIHLIINNQIGFTANPKDSRSTTYASDLAKSIDAPIFHVNGDDVEAVVKISDLAMRFRQEFKQDIVIDLICYRRYGHNEGDEPLYTQPVMYKKIKTHPTLEKIYSQKLISEGLVSEEQYQSMVQEFEAHLIGEFDKAADYKAKEADWLKSSWSGVKDGDNSIPKTAIAKNNLQGLIAKTLEIPAEFNPNKKVLRQLEARKSAVDNGEGIDWGCAESLAFASLLAEGFPVRLSGQDSGRGTFSHRHSVLHDITNGNRHAIFSPFAKTAKYEVLDSVLSEFGVLGFEYGYSLANPNALTIWEAQFGDFANGAQVIFDQFITSSEVKWLRKSGLVVLLPHGFEGQGPEHSSARLERYLQSCADNNIRVCNITNPANFFHALRRQIHGKDRKPLIVMSPKSLLRHKLATSTVEEFSDLNFRTIIPETAKLAADDKVKKVILCSGKVYYDLFEERENRKLDNVAIIRLEQLYPFPKEELKKELKKYKNAQIIWCQEEPKNMGAWQFAEDLIEEVLISVKHKISRPKYVGRIASSSPATGYSVYHNEEQKNLIDEALS